MTLRVYLLVGGLALCHCTDRVASSPDGGGPPDDAGPSDSSIPFDQDALPPPGSFCSLPGSIVSTPQGRMVVPGGVSKPDLTWLSIPTGFCVHYFGTVPTARQLRFAPGGDLFVASPTTSTTGGANNGIAGIAVLSDDLHRGVADPNRTFLSGLPSVQGLMFADGYLYYQDDTTILRVPFAAGDRSYSGSGETVTPMGGYPQAREHWPRVFDKALDGTIYISNGGSQSDVCDSARTVRGGIFRLNPDATTALVAKGFRNPIAMRCETNHNVCLVAELALDYSAGAEGREKIVPIRDGDDWGYPCCATSGVPYAGVTTMGTNATPDCAGVAAESDAFIIGSTPFGIDFETGKWPQPWNGRAFVTLHGEFGTWAGARLVAIALDPLTGLPLPASELLPSTGSGADNHLLDFATGWDDGSHSHGRPAPLAFAPDGRLFLGDDNLGTILWIAPIDLKP